MGEQEDGDLVERLDRLLIHYGLPQIQGHINPHFDHTVGDALQKSRDEIERLRSALEKIAGTDKHGTSGDGHAKCVEIARAALSQARGGE